MVWWFPATASGGVEFDAFRKSHEIDGTTEGEQTDYQAKVELDVFSARPTNAAGFQTTPTSDASGQCVHPSVLYFPDGWNGYKYWMAMTPYPAADDDYETPEILACDDGVNWVVPAGLTNPIVARDAANPNTDTCLFYNEATDELWVYYRKMSPDTYDKIYLKKSSDGIDWSGTGLGTLLLTGAYTEFLSPAIAKLGATYHLWYIDSTPTPGVIKHRTSADGETWGAEEACNLYGTMPAGKAPWHLEVRYMTEYSEYWMLLTLTDLGASGSPGWLTFARSKDGTDWYLYPIVLLKPSAAGWDDSLTYKATAILDGSTLKIWYSATTSGPRVWHVGYTTATIQLFDLFGHVETDGGDLRVTEDDGVTELEYWPEEFHYGGYAVVWVKMPTIPADPDSVTIYVYYGKAGETTTGSILDVMIKGDDGVAGNLTEDTKGTAAFSHVDGKYKITEDSIDDAFASGDILPSWEIAIEINIDEHIGPGGDGDGKYMFGLFDEDVIGELCGTSAAVAGKRRFIISRDASNDGDEDPVRRNKVGIGYFDAGAGEHNWDGSAWNGVVRHDAPGTLKFRIWSDGTTIYADVLSSRASIFASPASIAIASVKAFSAGVCLAWVDLYTNAYWVLATADNYFIRKYVDPEPTQGAWGAEESVVWPF